METKETTKNPKTSSKGWKYEYTGKNNATRNKFNISDDEVRERAYRIFLERGGLPGSSEADWYLAEEQLIREAYKKRKT
jgi:hypothetical protein